MLKKKHLNKSVSMGCCLFVLGIFEGGDASAVEVGYITDEKSNLVAVGRINDINSGGKVNVEVGGVVISAIPVDGEVETVDASTAVDSYAVSRGGLLNIIDGGVADHVYVTGASLDIRDGSVRSGIHLFDSAASLLAASVSSDSGTGLIIGSIQGTVKPGSTAVVTSSNIHGVGSGIGLGVYGVLKLYDTDVDGKNSPASAGSGITVAGGQLFVGEKSYIKGDYNGLKIVDGSDFGSGVIDGAKSKVVVNDSIVEGGGGAAIKVTLFSSTGTHADIDIQNNSVLLSGNGNLLEVEDRSTANFKVDDSRLNGNLVAFDTSILNVTLQESAQLTGNIINSNSLAINSGASWQMVDDSNVKSLSMNGGRVSFGEGAFKTLTLGELSGNGTFDMRINLDNHSGDLLKVNGQANGNHTLKVQNTGLELVTPEVEPLMVVDTEGGDAQFDLLGGKADLGVYSYELEQRGDDWFIVGSGKTISPSTQSVLALFNAAPNIWNSELSTLRSRMGEVRGKPLGGAWMRSYGSRFNASTGDGVNYQQKQSGLTLGVDAPLQVGIGELSLGVMVGYSKNDLDLSRGTTGNVDSYYVGGYGTWLLDDGYYLDGVLKLNRFRNESKVAMSDGTKAKGDYESSAVGGSLEFGRHINFADGYFLEPYAQLSSVWVQGDSYTLDNGMQANNERTQSTLGKVGTSAGRSIALKDGGVLTPYVRVAMAQEFSGSNDVKVNDKRFGNDLSGSRAELGAGVSVSLSERLQLHADFDYMKGKNVEQPWGANVGLKLAF